MTVPPEPIRRLAEAIRSLSTGPATLMEVCGTHTVAIARAGLRRLLPPELRLLSGPGCPVCVTPAGVIDQAIALARRPGVLLATFGDMMRVPGSAGSLEAAAGAAVRVLYSPHDALALAAGSPERTVVFLGIGFETTAPTVAAMLLEARRRRLANLLVLPAFKRVTPALDALLGLPGLALDGLILPGHVSAVIGSRPYEPVLARHRRPGVVTGFTPEEILRGVAALLMLVRARSPEVRIAYRRAVPPVGNPAALAVMDEVLAPEGSRWRGLGWIEASGLGLAPAFAERDARRVFDLAEIDVPDPPGCACGAVLQGALAPADCPLFGRTCTPAAPVGPCMVSSEGACAAHHRYGDCDPP